MNSKIKVGITHGDYNGVGYEIIFKALADERIPEIMTPVVFGSSDLAAHTIRDLQLEGVHFTPVRSAAEAQDGRINIVDICSAQPQPTPGVPSQEAGQSAFASLAAACAALEEGEIDVLVTAPIDKNSIHSEEFSFPGHTEYLADRFPDPDEKQLMVLFDDHVRVALVTTHLPIARVAEHITKENVLTAIKAFDRTLRKDFGIDRPLIAVLGLNPHCGDRGLIGEEEATAISPAIETAVEEGTLAFGPFPADGFFANGLADRYDGVLAMYHDQGLAPFKAIAGQRGVNFTAGLEFVRTSPDHGTAYDIAGKGEADHTSMLQAIYRAIDIYRARRRWEEMTENPLKFTRPKEERNKMGKSKTKTTDPSRLPSEE